MPSDGTTHAFARRRSRLLSGAIFALTIQIWAAPSARAVVTDQATNEDKLAITLLQTPRARCSGVIVGPRTILTSASCFAPELSISAQIGTLHATCTAYPKFFQNISTDLALCVATAPIPSTRIERISADPGIPQKGQSIAVAGVGCADSQSHSSTDFAIGGGLAQVLEAADPKTGRMLFLGDGVALCTGDSGGGAFMGTAADRKLVGVASLSDGKNTTWFASVADGEFVRWATDWSDQEHAPICGIDRNESACVPESQPDATTSEAPILVSELTQLRFRKGDTLRTLVAKACDQTQPAAYFKLLQKMGNSPTYFSSADAQVGSDGVVEIPSCDTIDAAPIADKSIDDGNSIYRIYRNLFGAKGWEAGKFEPDTPPGTEHDNANNFKELFLLINPMIDPNKALPVGARVFVPNRSLRKLESSIEVSLATPTLSLRPQFALPSTQVDCVRPKDPQSYPFDVGALLDILEANRQFHHVNGTTLNSISVTIADSGLWTRGVNPFTPSLPEGNAHSKEFEPLDDSAEMGHGTNVASVVLGGPLFARFLALLPTRIRLNVTRLYKRTVYITPDAVDQPGKLHRSQSVTVDDAAFRKFISASRHFDIANLSIKSTDSMEDLHAKLSSQYPTLFVVAAGNDDGELDTQNNHIYPAMYGGEKNDGVYNLISVGAVGGDNRWAKFSNKGSSFIELSAPGCAVPVLSYNSKTDSWTTDLLSGTSVAAPLVAFTAALIDSEATYMWATKLEPVEIKQRLLASADLDETMAAKVYDGRVLNIYKAVNLFSDTVETSTGDPLLMGNVKFRVNEIDKSYLDLDCGSGPSTIAVSHILKMVPSFHHDANEPRPMRLYLQDAPGARLEEKDCKLPPYDVDVEMVDLEGKDHILALSQVKDYVKAMPHDNQ